MPFGTRGGFVVKHNFPADGEYELTIGDMALAREVPRMEFENTVVVLLDGEELYRTKIGGEADHKVIDQTLDPAVEAINGRLRKIRFNATGRAAPSRRDVRRTAASPKATSAREPSRSRAARSASKPRMRCRFAGRCWSPASASPRAARRSSRAGRAKPPRSGRVRREIVTSLAERAFRRPVGDSDLESA